jgi:6-phosphogluconolactonase (cycloisomerase 2 family)
MPSSVENRRQTSNRTSLYAIDRGKGSLTKTFHGPTGADPNWIEFVSLR